MTILLRTTTGNKVIEPDKLAQMVVNGKVKPSSKAASVDDGKTWITIAEALSQSPEVVDLADDEVVDKEVTDGEGAKGTQENTAEAEKANESPSQTKDNKNVMRGCGCLVIGVVLLYIIGVVVQHCSLNSGVPRAVWKLVDDDFEKNHMAYATMQNAERIQPYGASALNPTTTRGGEKLPNQYTYEVKIVGKTNALGTHQEAVGNLRYKYDPDKNTIELLRIDVFDASWK